MGDDLESRLMSHSRSLEGLLSLIPAKEYYGKDASITSEQWRKTKKQTKKERQDAKRAKLDPASHKTAKDVLDENALKRKRELEGDDHSSDIDLGIEKEKPFEGLKIATPKAKKVKTSDDADKAEAANEESEQAKNKAKAEKRRQKREEKKEKAASKKAKLEEKKARKEEAAVALGGEDTATTKPQGDEVQTVEPPVVEASEAEDEDRMDVVDVSGLIEEIASTATPSGADSAGSTSSVVSAASSTSSIVPPPNADNAANSENPAKKKFELSPEKHEAFKARLQARLHELRAKRKADDPKNRTELLAARRKKAEDHKLAKKNNRQMAKEEEARLKTEAELARLRGSGSPYSISGMISSRNSPEHEHNLAFGRVAWKDGQQLDTKLSGFLDPRKRKGPSDPKTALEAAEKKRARISGLDPEKKADIETKDLWLAAKKRAQGEKVHDNPALIKKSLKRKEKEKAKSKQEWKERITGIAKGQAMKQKKREENLTKRRDESKKGSKVKGHKVKSTKKKPAAKKVKRAGFEGTFSGR